MEARASSSVSSRRPVSCSASMAASRRRSGGDGGAPRARPSQRTGSGPGLNLGSGLQLPQGGFHDGSPQRGDGQAV